MKKVILQGHSTYDGAGVKLKRVFAHDHTELTDPFLLLDHFGSDNPDDYVKGFPWHPHRGIETVTYMLGGTVEHGDSIGNSGTIGPGDIQWMTAGGGVLHQEMPKAAKGMMHGLQLWVNLPAKNKMMEPRYRGILEKEVPVVKIPGGEVRVVAGVYENVTGPVQELVVDVEYLDVRLKKGMSLSRNAKKGYTSFCYLIEGTGVFDDTKLEQAQLILFTEAGSVAIKAIEDIHYIFVTGKQLNEPIAWGGPIVMNTDEELQLAFEEYRNGSFVKHKKS
ncbi:MAG: pirin family protein [Deltaproteobacteria bacterium]|nr:pirin family protein [Deltaproteobacteria bacterium]